MTDQLCNGATIDDMTSAETFQITGRGTVLIVDLPIYNRQALRGRTVSIDGSRYEVRGVESCLVIGHDEGACDRAAGLLVRPILPS